MTEETQERIWLAIVGAGCLLLALLFWMILKCLATL